MLEAFRAIKTFLATTDLNDADKLNGRFYEGQAPKRTSFPYLTFQAISHTGEPALSEDDVRLAIQINLYGDRTLGGGALWALNDLLLSELDRQRLTVTGFSAACILAIDRGVEELEEDGLRITSQWDLFMSPA